MEANLARELKRLVEQVTPWAIALRRDLHRIPEIGNQEFRSSERIKNALDALGISNRSVLGTGLIGTIPGSRNEEPVEAIGFRADIDGLPITEAVRLPYSSEREGFMHACGHDVHAAVLLGLAKVLSQWSFSQIHPVRLIFQPAEETTGGAERMITAGCLSDPIVKEIYGLHVKPDLLAGEIGIGYGIVHASSDQFQIRMTGRGSHGAAPDAGIDAIVAASSLVTSLQTIVSRTISPLDAAVVTVGTFHSGSAVNVIAEEAVLTGTIRAFKEDLRETIKKKIMEQSDGIAKAYGSTAHVEFTPGYDALSNWKEQVDLVRKAAEHSIGVDHIKILERPSMGVEDFTYYLKKTKGAFFFLGSGFPHRLNPPLHSDHFLVNEACIQTGIQVLATLAIDRGDKK